MALKNLVVAYPPVLNGVRRTIRRSDGQVWTGTGVVFEAYNPANVNTYGQAMTQQGTSLVFEKDFPTALPEDHYHICYQQPAGATLVEDDDYIGFEDWDWDGAARTSPSNLKKVLSTLLTEGAAGRLAGGVVKFFNVAAPTGTLLSLPDAVPGAANGLHVLGANIANVTYAGLTGVAMRFTGANDVSAGIVISGGGLTPSSAPALVIDGNTTLTGIIAATNAGNDVRGVKLHATGLDAISAADATAVATTFREKLIQVWQRFFLKTQYDSGAGTLKTFAAGGSTVITTQATSNVGDTETVGEASTPA